MKKLLLVLAVLAVSACSSTGTIGKADAVIDPSLTAAPICQPNYGLSGCYAGNGGGE